MAKVHVIKAGDKCGGKYAPLNDVEIHRIPRRRHGILVSVTVQARNTDTMGGMVAKVANRAAFSDFESANAFIEKVKKHGANWDWNYEEVRA